MVAKMMYNLQGALFLSTGDKAKTRKDGKIIIVAMRYISPEIDWQIGWIDEKTGEGNWYGCLSRFSRIWEDLYARGIHENDYIWLPVETPFPEENK